MSRNTCSTCQGSFIFEGNHIGREFCIGAENPFAVISRLRLDFRRRMPFRSSRMDLLISTGPVMPARRTPNILAISGKVSCLLRVGKANQIASGLFGLIHCHISQLDNFLRAGFMIEE